MKRNSLIDALVNALGARVTETEQMAWWHKIVLLCAPAGYGKTTLLVDVAKAIQIPCCWAMLDAQEKEPSAFLELLFNSIRYLFPNFGLTNDQQLSRIVSHNREQLALAHYYETCVDEMIEAIEKDIPERFVLMLCNYQEVNESATINTILNRLLAKLPTHCIILLESRTIPKIDVAPLLARRQIIGFGTDYLRFTAQDICDLTNVLHSSPMSVEDAEKLCQAFDGWISGILLGTHFSRTTFLTTSLHENSESNISVEQQHLFSYMATEVFKYEPQVYMLLRQLSILQKMEPALCNRLLTIDDANERLKYIEQQGLFVTHSREGKQRSYICHPLLREFLLTELREQEPERFRALNAHASHLFYERQEYESSIYHALEAQDYDFATNLMISSARSILRKGYSEILVQWIDTLPTAILEQNPILLVIRARIFLLKYEPEKTHPFLEKALAVLDQHKEQDKSIDTATRAEIFLVRGMALFRTGNYKLTQQMCTQAIELLQVDERELRAQAYQHLGACACLQGHCVEGIAYLQQSLHLWQYDTEARQTALLHTYLANAYNITGNYALAEHHRTRSIQNFEYLGDAWGKVHSLIGLGSTKHYKGTLQEAEEIILQALVLARQAKFANGEAYSLLNLGEIYRDQGQYERALTVAEDGLRIARSLHDSYLTNCILCVLATSYLFMGDTSSALLFVDEIKFAPTDAGGYIDMLSSLTRGSIFFWQKRYQEAENTLTRLDQVLQTSELKHVHVRTLVYLAACLQSQGQTAKMKLTLEDLEALILQVNGEYTAQIELKRLPDLWRVIQTIPSKAFLSNQSSAVTNKTPQSENEPPVLLPAEKGPQTGPFQVFAFGEPTVLIDGTPISRWRMARSMELFFYLLDIGRPVHKEQIMTALWPEADDHIEQSLRTVVYHLRKVLGDQCILNRSSTYELTLAPTYGEDIWYDINVFQNHAARAKKLLARQDEAAAEALLQEMVSLYKGDYVQSFYSDWSIKRRDELRTMYLEARRQLAQLAWEKEAIDTALEHWQQMLVIDDCQEEVHCGIIGCYIKQGKRSLALRQYQRCVQVLQEELAIPPGPTIQKLYESLI